VIINKLRVIASKDAQTSWKSLKRFQNVAFVAGQIESIHNVQATHRRNVVKQAEQLRYCLVQAAEYFEAARAVSLATKPVLLYYGTMSLALAEILFKQDGGSSLDAARGQNAHHGLTFHLSGQPPKTQKLDESALLLKARPLVKDEGERVGTFELWHRSSREAPVCCVRTFRLERGSQTGPAVIATGADERFPVLEETGLTLLDCFQSLPSMRAILGQLSIGSRLVRARIELEVHGDNSFGFKLIVHPGYAPTNRELMPLLHFGADLVDHIDVVEMDRTSYIVKISAGAHLPQLRLSLPRSFQSKADELFFCTRHPALNEFGFYYLAIYMLGNYARYHPEAWMSDVEKCTELATAAETFIAAVEERVPLLALSELSQATHLLD
jgi:hypothetical protein